MSYNYIQHQLARLREGDTIAIKLVSMNNADSTNFINLTQRQLQQVKAVLRNESDLAERVQNLINGCNVSGEIEVQHLIDVLNNQ